MGLIANPPNASIPCAIYARVSPKPEGAAGDNFSIASQLHEMRALALKKYHNPDPDVYIDKDKSGSTLDRPELDRLRDNLALKLYKGGAVIALSPDRWSRGDEIDNVILDQELAKGGAKLDFCSGSYEDSPEGELARDVQRSVSKYERKKFRERSRRCRRQKSRDGFPHACHAPDGYQYEGHKFGKKGEYVKDPERAPIIYMIFRMIAWEGYTEPRLARWLNQQGIKTHKGFRWARNSVSQVLAKECYTGEMMQNGSLVKVPVIVPRALWDAAHEALERNKAGKRGRPPRQYLLSHYLWCARCGKRMTSFPKRGDDAAYRCNHVDHVTRERQCFAPEIRKSILEPVVWAAIWHAVCDPGLLWKLIEAYYGRVNARPKKSDPSMQRIDRARRLVERRQQILDDPDQDFDTANANLKAAKKELAAAQLAAPGGAVVEMPVRKDVEAARLAFLSMERELDHFEDRRAAVEVLVEKVRYSDGEAEIHCHIPTPTAGKCHSRIRGNDIFSGPIPFVIKVAVPLERTPDELTAASLKGWETRRKRRVA
jgi:site-specific DNA recombinase